MTDDTDTPNEAELTFDHDMVREWADEHDAVPVRNPDSKGKDVTDLALVARDDVDDSQQELSWEAFFEQFEDETLGLLHGSDSDDVEAADLVNREGHFRV